MRSVLGLSALRRFQFKVYARGDCWEWRGPISDTGYGSMHVNGETALAHRFAYDAAKGAIPHGLELDHLCRHRWCVRPTHLEAVTRVVNTRRGECGKATAARKAAITHCPAGHPYTAENTYRHNGKRSCKICKLETTRRWKRRQQLREEVL